MKKLAKSGVAKRNSCKKPNGRIAIPAILGTSAIIAFFSMTPMQEDHHPTGETYNSETTTRKIRKNNLGSTSNSNRGKATDNPGLSREIADSFESDPIRCDGQGNSPIDILPFLHHNYRVQMNPLNKISGFSPPNRLLIKMEEAGNNEILRALDYLGTLDLTEVEDGGFRKISRISAMRDSGKAPSPGCSQGIAKGYILATRGVEVLIERSLGDGPDIGFIADSIPSDFETIFYDRLAISLFQNQVLEMDEAEQVVLSLSDDQKTALFNHLYRFIGINMTAMENAHIMLNNTGDEVTRECLRQIIERSENVSAKMLDTAERYDRFLKSRSP
jgi:hypothetical protein